MMQLLICQIIFLRDLSFKSYLISPVVILISRFSRVLRFADFCRWYVKRSSDQCSTITFCFAWAAPIYLAGFKCIAFFSSIRLFYIITLNVPRFYPPLADVAEVLSSSTASSASTLSQRMNL